MNPGGYWNESNFHFEEDLLRIRAYGMRPIINMYVAVDVRNTDNRILNVSKIMVL